MKIHVPLNGHPRVTEYNNLDGSDIPINGFTALLIRYGTDDDQFRMVTTIQEWRELNLIVEQTITDLPETRAWARKDQAQREKLRESIAAARAELAKAPR